MMAVTALRFSTVIWPDAAQCQAINTIRARYDAHYHAIGPHITVAFPDRVVRPLNEIQAGMRWAARQTPPFTAVLDRWLSATELFEMHEAATRFLMERYPNAVNFIVLVAERGNVEMLALRRVFHQVIPQPELLMDYPLYMTLGQSLSDEDFARARAELADYRPHVELHVERFDLLAEQPDGTWPVVDTFVLGKG